MDSSRGLSQADKSPHGSVRARSVSRSRSARDSAASTRSHSILRKEPLYEEVSAKSPPLTSFLNDRHSASSLEESAYLSQATYVRHGRLALSVLIIATAGAAVGCTAHVLRSYNVTHLGRSWFLPLWPSNIDLRPTLSILVPAAVAIVSSLAYLAVALVPSPRSRTSFLNILFTSTTVVSLVATIFAVVFNLVLIHHVDPGRRESLQSFTCKFYHGAASFNSDASKLQLPIYGAINSPAGFKRICIESEAAIGLAIGLICLEVTCLAVAGTGMWLEKKITKSRDARHQEKWEASS